MYRFKYLNLICYVVLLLAINCKKKEAVSTELQTEKQLAIALEDATKDFIHINKVLEQSKSILEVIQPLELFLANYEIRNKLFNEVENKYPEMVNNLISKYPNQSKKMRVLNDRFSKNIADYERKYSQSPEFLKIYQRIEQVLYYKNE